MVAEIADWLNWHSNMLQINTIIFRVRADEPNVQNSKFVIDLHYEPEFVASNIENNAISLKKARMPVSTFDVFRSFPDRL